VSTHLITFLKSVLTINQTPMRTAAVVYT